MSQTQGASSDAPFFGCAADPVKFFVREGLQPGFPAFTIVWNKTKDRFATWLDSQFPPVR